MPFDLRARISLDGSAFARGLETVRGQANNAARDISVQFASAFEDLGSIIDAVDLSGVSAEFLQQLKADAEDTGNSLGNVISAINRMAVASRNALDGSDDLAKAFERLGVSTEMLTNGSIETRLKAIRDAVRSRNIDDSLIADLNQVMGRGGGRLISTFRSDSNASAVSTETARAVDEAGDIMNEIGRGIRSASASFIAGFVTPLLRFATLRTGKPGGLSPEDRQSIAGAEADEEATMTAKERREAEKEAKKLAAEREEHERNIARLTEQQTDASRDLQFSRLKTDQERAQFIRKEIAELQKRANDALLKGDLLAVRQVGIDATRKQQELEGILAQGAGGSFVPQGNSLRSVGNFLGGDPNAGVTSELKTIAQTLKRIERQRLNGETLIVP